MPQTNSAFLISACVCLSICDRRLSVCLVDGTQVVVAPGATRCPVMQGGDMQPRERDLAEGERSVFL